MNERTRGLVCLVLLVWIIAQAPAGASAPELPLVPWPQSLTLAGGDMTLSASSRITYSDPALSNLAQVLAEEIEEVTRLQPTTAQDAPVAGDIHLAFTLDPTITGEVHKVTVAAHATVEGETYQAVALGSVTLLQVIKDDAGTFSLPIMTVIDEPDIGYRGLMVDVARKDHEIRTLKEVVKLCRLYKIRYLQFHLTDDQGCTFPLQAYPLVPSWGSRLTYTLAELNDLVAFADARGVTLIPEIESPGHANCFTKSMPDFFGTSAGSSVINIADDAVWDAMETVLNEVCDVFQSAPWFHIAGDEVNFAGLGDDPGWEAAVLARGVGNYAGLYNAYLSHLVQVVEDCGKKAIIWDGFDSSRTGNAEMDKRAVVMIYNQIERAQSYLDDGHQIMNACWVPLYQVGDGYGSPPERIYEFQKFRFGDFDDHFPRGDLFRYLEIDPTPDLLGAQYCSWELPGEREMPLLRFRLPPYADRVWNPANTNDYGHFDTRYTETDQLLQMLAAEHRPPEVPVGFGASDGMYPDKVRVGWEDGGNYPIKFELYRNTVNNSGTAQVVAGDLPWSASAYDDTNITAGVTYHYWARAWNKWGWSPLTAAASGETAPASNQAHAYEPFDYTAGASVAGRDGGVGFDGPWVHAGVNGTVDIVPDTLTYPGLPSRGGALEMDIANESDPSASVQRSLEGVTGHDLSEVWVSFLVKPVELRNGSIYLQLNGKTEGVSIMKKWVNGFGFHGYARSRLVEGETVLLVARYDCRPGLDRAYCWFNPPLDQEPSLEEADSSTLPGRTLQGDLGLGDMLALTVARAGMGRYLFDELRIGDSWEDAIGQGVGGDPDDHDPPNPDPMQWDTPPQALGATAVTMLAATGTDSNGVAYLFEETGGNPGGSDSGWQPSPSYTDSGLEPETVYTYRVKARDLSVNHNETDWSPSLSVTTSVETTMFFYEGFDYTPGSQVTDSATWTAGTEGSQATVAGSSVGLPGLPTSGRAADLFPTTTWDGMYHDLTSPITRGEGDELWISYARQQASRNNSGLQLHLYNGGTDIGWFGKYGYQTYNTLNIGGTRVDTPGGVVPVDTPELIVLKIAYGAASQDAHMWVNPSLTGEPTVGAADLSVLGFTTDATSISRLQLRFIKATGDMTVDEIRVADTWWKAFGLSGSGDAYLDWSQAKGLDAGNNGIALNPDFDELDNLLEFITDSNPLSPTGNHAVAYTLVSGTPHVAFKRNDDAEDPDFLIFVEYSEDLESWTNVAVVGDTYLASENGADADDMRVPMPAPTGSRQFARLGATRM